MKHSDVSASTRTEEPLWSGRICPDHPDYRGSDFPRESRCKNCWRVLLGYPTRMYTDRFAALTAAPSAGSGFSMPFDRTYQT